MFSVSVMEILLIATETQTPSFFPTGSSFVQISTLSPASEGNSDQSKAAFLSVSMRPFQGVWEVKTIFILSHYLPFSLSFFYEYTLDFSRGCHVILQQIECRSRYENPAVFY